MSALKTNFWQEITLALKAMWKTCTNLSKKVFQLERNQKTSDDKIELLELQVEEMLDQQKMMISQVTQVAGLQTDIAKQVVAQHHETEVLMKGLGLKQDLSYYSFNLHNEEGH